MKPAILAWIVVAIGILTANTAAHAPLPDLDSCHDELDQVRREASDASDAAEDAKSSMTNSRIVKKTPNCTGAAVVSSRTIKTHLASYKAKWTIWTTVCDQ